ncbi:hypothetical protein SAMN04488505_10731 [Chitinophaga rupis]|uniref:Uncharacterized protein n=1 Tax=Chitinophaga rupis TaxID=573321 RepID=A0A1H8C8T4_9BACT|nr:hypothetical protein SAMN04488505_10731 [Chitinophaga rupis]
MEATELPIVSPIISPGFLTVIVYCSRFLPDGNIIFDVAVPGSRQEANPKYLPNPQRFWL